MLELFKKFLREDDGQDVVEYVLLIVLVALAIAAASPNITDSITGVFDDVDEALKGDGG